MHRATGKGVSGGCCGLIVLGMVGAVVGGYVSRFIGGQPPTGLDLRSVAVSVVGALLALLIARALFGHRQ